MTGMNFISYPNETGYDIFCRENQKIMARLVHQHVFYNITELVERLRENMELLSDDDEEQAVHNLIGRTDYEEAARFHVADIVKKEFGDHITSASEDSVIDEIVDDLKDSENLARFCTDENIELEEYTQDVHSHHVVSCWMADNLVEAQGETVQELFNMKVWGRTNTGQLIELDSVIAKIAIRHEMLMGQAGQRAIENSKKAHAV